MTMQQSVESKNMLAKLLATENISIRVNPSASTASFDIKNRVLYLPQWKNISEDMHDMLLVHETGHALDTPYQDWIDAIDSLTVKHYKKKNAQGSAAIRSFLNIVEDSRIDKRQKRRFPGARKNYAAAYRELLERDFFRIAGKDVNALSFIDRANLYFKGGSFLLNIQFTPEERVFLHRIDNTETWDEVVALTDEIFTWAKKDGLERKHAQTVPEYEQDEDEESDEDPNDDYDFEDGKDDSDDDEDEDEESEGVASLDSDEESDVESDKDSDDEDEESDVESSSDSKSDDENETDDEDASSDGADSPQEDEDSFVPEVTTDEALEENRKQFLANSTDIFSYYNIPKPILEDIVDDYKKFLDDYKNEFADNPSWTQIMQESFNTFRNTENTTISYMVKEFEMKKSADLYSRISIAKTGQIDMNKLHSYKYNDDIFRRISTIPQGKNHGFCMFLDWSGSMTYNLSYTIRQLLTLTFFCKRVQIPFEVYIFRNPIGSEMENKQFWDQDISQSGRHDIQLDPFKLRNVLSSRMNSVELNRAYFLMWLAAQRAHLRFDRMSDTPLNSAIVAASPIINAFAKKNKIQIVNTIFLTDGESNYIPNIGGNFYTTEKTHRVLVDDQTKKQYTLSDPNGPAARSTAILLKILRDRTQSNLVGFYLFEGNFSHMRRKFFNYNADISKIREKWNNDRFLSVVSEGYDEYYVLNTKNKTMVDEGLQVSSDMSKSAIAKAFIKFSEKKSINRVLLKKFVDRISKVANTSKLN